MIRSHMLIGQDLSGEQVLKAFYNSTKNIKYLEKSLTKREKHVQ